MKKMCSSYNRTMINQCNHGSQTFWALVMFCFYDRIIQGILEKNKQTNKQNKTKQNKTKHNTTHTHTHPHTHPHTPPHAHTHTHPHKIKIKKTVCDMNFTEMLCDYFQPPKTKPFYHRLPMWESVHCTHPLLTKK